MTNNDSKAHNNASLTYFICTILRLASFTILYLNLRAIRPDAHQILQRPVAMVYHVMHTIDDVQRVSLLAIHVFIPAVGMICPVEHLHFRILIVPVTIIIREHHRVGDARMIKPYDLWLLQQL